MNLFTVTQENWEQEITELFSGDEDYNGNNGIGYTSEEAQAKGFESDLEHDVHEAKNFSDNWKEQAEHLLFLFANLPSNVGCYDAIEYEVLDLGEELVVGFVCIQMES